MWRKAVDQQRADPKALEVIRELGKLVNDLDVQLRHAVKDPKVTKETLDADRKGDGTTMSPALLAVYRLNRLQNVGMVLELAAPRPQPQGRMELLLPAPRAGKSPNETEQERKEKERKQLDELSDTLDAAGIVDPTPVSDGLNALIHLGRGNLGSAGVSAAAMIPYLGDVLKGVRAAAKAVANATAKAVAKVRRIGKSTNAAGKATHEASRLGAKIAPARLFDDAAAWANQQGRHAIANAPRPVRGGAQIGAGEFGDIIRWGEGPGQARELLRDLQGMSAHRPEALRAYLDGLRRQGVTPEMAARWSEGYRVASQLNPPVGGATAPERARLMRFIAEQLAGGN